MMRAAAVMMFGATALLAAGCNQYGGMAGGASSVEFVAANSSTVLIDYARGNTADGDAAKQMAVEKCALFGGRTAVLESLNIRGDGKERAAFLCQ
jgi:hypothetical protein